MIFSTVARCPMLLPVPHQRIRRQEAGRRIIRPADAMSAVACDACRAGSREEGVSRRMDYPSITCQVPPFKIRPLTRGGSPGLLQVPPRGCGSSDAIAKTGLLYRIIRRYRLRSTLSSIPSKVAIFFRDLLSRVTG